MKRKMLGKIIRGLKGEGSEVNKGRSCNEGKEGKQMKVKE